MKITTVRVVARTILPVLLAAIGYAGIGRARAITGTIIGTITDATGAVIPSATIAITDKENGSSNQRTTDASGQYTAPFLQPAHYRVHAEAPGFNAVANDDAVVSNVVNVTAALLLVESGSSALGQVVERQITRLAAHLLLGGQHRRVCILGL